MTGPVMGVPERGFVRLAHGDLHVRRLGDGAAVVMLHASPASGATLVPLATTLSAQMAGRRLLLPDTPGNGGSDRLADERPEMADYAAAFEAWADAEGLGVIDLYGTHTGAHVAIEWTLAAPARVRRLVLDGVAVMEPEERAAHLAAYAPPLVPDVHGTHLLKAWHLIRDQMIFWPHYRQTPEHFRTGGQLGADVLHGLVMDLLAGMDSYHLAYAAVFRHEVLERLGLLRLPLLWLREAGAPLAGGEAAALARVRQARVVDVDGVAARAAAVAAFLGD